MGGARTYLKQISNRHKRDLHTMKQALNRNTFMVFSIDRQRLKGPILQNEIQACKEIYFGMYRPEQIMVMEETVFASRWPKVHSKHITTHWQDKLYCYFRLEESWIGKVYLSEDPLGFAGSWFHLFYNNDESGTAPKFQINTTVIANRFHAAKLREDVIAMFPNIPLYKGAPYYNGSDQMTHIGTVAGDADDPRNSGAYQRHLAEIQVVNACLS